MLRKRHVSDSSLCSKRIRIDDDKDSHPPIEKVPPEILITIFESAFVV